METDSNSNQLYFEKYQNNLVKIDPFLGVVAFTKNLHKYIELSEDKRSYNVLIPIKKFELIKKIITQNKKILKLINDFKSNSYLLVKKQSIVSGQDILYLLKKEIDVEEYKRFNPDLHHLNKKEVLAHFKNFGKNENRNTDSYVYLFNNLLKGKLENEHFKDFHVFGNDFNGKNPFFRGGLEKKDIKQDIKPSFKSYRLGVKSPLLLSFHAYYFDEIYNYLPVIKEAYNIGYNVHISLSWESNSFYKIRDLLGFNPFITYVENIGRDLIGHHAAFNLFSYQNFQNIEAFLILHTKKSLHVNEDFRKYWVDSLIGWMLQKKNNETKLKYYTEEIIKKKISQVGGAACRCVGKENLSDKNFYNYPGCENWPFVSGTMSLVSGDVIRKTLMQFNYSDFRDNPIKTQKQNMIGGLPHILERIISYEAQIQNGIKWI